ncbi:Serine/threonine-protein phosphatase 4 regulatory subunit 2-A [Schistosoma japonicum]|uniref:Serine/threonine-protein phosphatase 4 regulatory subunit 2-A n=1 Tax=Schistosoma japonicum TaxID=6182 RepID=A0A4Z2D4L5_SCHJA|nr:Serine/threonine-protein phosphatase 4 regulatory subunit 2-A [Schistosoma japonicum]TNN11406.1 Serine/threonine-protein phosphatase 4 regulatory subunit 2-A [Schistosoma japonicum]
MTLLPMENGESILCALKCFEQEKPISIPPILEDYIKQIARNGQTRLPWIYVKPLLLHKYNKVVDSFISEGSSLDYSHVPTPPHLSELRQRVFNTLKKLDGIPFTIQRICELFDSPTHHYQRVDKFLRGLEKVCMVVSTVDPYGNKIHQEDPRFPSRAGLDDCGLIMDSSITSPPSSPSDNSQVHHISKSSDEEVTEEDDEGEDISNNSSDERHSPKTNHRMNSTPLINSSCANSWLFKAQNALNLPHTPPMPFRTSVSKGRVTDQSLTNAPLLSGLCGSLLSAYSNNDEEDYEQLNHASENKHVNSNTQANADHLASVASNFRSESSECIHTLPLESSLQEKPASDTSHVTSSVVQDQIQDDSLPWNEANKISTMNSKTLEVVVSQCDNKLNEISCGGNKPSVSNVNQDESPSRGLELDTTGSENDFPTCQVLRPIGQLEAFVQNLNSDVSSSATSVSLHNGSPKSTSDPSAHLSCVASVEELSHQGSLTSPTSNSFLPVLVGVRRPRSPGMDSTSSDSSVSTYEDTDLSESPAKKRKLPSSDSIETIEPSTDSLVGIGFQVVTSSSLALNDSPPIIMCNPMNQTRDLDSGECVFKTTENPSSCQPTVDPVSIPDSTTNLHGVENISFTRNSDLGSESVETNETVLINSQDTGLLTVNLSNINSETGEEES